MAKTSIIIPSRDERFLQPTIADIFRNRRSDTEVIAVLDSDKWPDGWKEFTAQYPDLHTIHNGKSLGMRAAINRGVASAVSRGAKFIMKLDGHCSLQEGFDEVLKADCEPNWVVVPRRGRLDPENWIATDTHKPDIDYHYLSFPDDVNDFGGPGLNGKVWEARALERKDILVDEEMSSQGSCWFMHARYFEQLELMDEANYGPFWNEMQEVGLKCWLSGGQLMVNKKTRYLHLHKGKKYGRGYRLPESALKQGAGYTKKWLFNEAWAKQTLPFKTLIERFWPVPGWPENWEELVYGSGKSERRWLTHKTDGVADKIVKVNEPESLGEHAKKMADWIHLEKMPLESSLKIHNAVYGISLTEGIDVTAHLQSLVQNGSLDVVVNNSTVTPGQNPFRGKLKTLKVTYSYDGGDPVTVERREKEWLIIGQASRYVKDVVTDGGVKDFRVTDEGVVLPEPAVDKAFDELYAIGSKLAPAEIVTGPMTAPALNDYLIRKFRIPAQRLRGPMPIEIRDFHRDNLAQLFAELGFKRGAEIGVAEGKYSEVLLKAAPDMGLLLVDPWHHYSGNPQNKTPEKNQFAFEECKRRIAPFGSRAEMVTKFSMDAVRNVKESSLDMVYIDGHHGFDYVMQDLIEWSKRVRSGGIVSGDDLMYLDEKRWGAGPIEAVQAYVKAHRISIWYIFQGHRSVDYMWVQP